jgi:hypothetical protein
MARETTAQQNEITARQSATSLGKVGLITCRQSDGVRADIIMRNRSMDPSNEQRLGTIIFQPKA